MKFTSTDICRVIEEKISGTHCIVSPTGDQIAVIFNNRPDTVIHLLTPYLQIRLKAGKFTKNDIDLIISDLQNISENKKMAKAIIDDLNESSEKWAED